MLKTKTSIVNRSWKGNGPSYSAGEFLVVQRRRIFRLNGKRAFPTPPHSLLPKFSRKFYGNIQQDNTILSYVNVKLLTHTDRPTSCCSLLLNESELFFCTTVWHMVVPPWWCECVGIGVRVVF